MKIAWFKKDISPEIGTKIAGYTFHDVSVCKGDPLYMTGLCMDNGTDKTLLISFDLLAMDGWYVRQVRRECAEILHTREELIMLTCTHNHSGPESATPGGSPESFNRPYVDKLEQMILEEVRNLHDYHECDVRFYSSRCDENRNRRYTTADNVASFTPHRREVSVIAQEYADKELGEIVFFEPGTRKPLYLIGNYAAHPLAGHSPGIGGLRISADFPGAFRNYVTEETGAECMYVTGAAGDLVPRQDELGSGAAKQMGIRLGQAAIGGMIDMQRNPHRFILENEKLGGKISTFTVPIRKKYIGHLPPEYAGKENVTLEVQCLAIGDICFVGVPGELCCELGQEIKWHSVFRRAFIAYYSTADFSYMGPANFMVSGGYEGATQQFSARGGITLVNTAINAMFDLHEEMFPSKEGEPYPECLNQPLVDIPKN